jgi:hypothetical protein
MDIFSPTPTSLAPSAERPSTPADHRRGLLFVSAVCRRVASMRGIGKLGIGLLAIVALLALPAASALAATPITVTETTDAPLESGANACESTDIAKGCTLRAAVDLANKDGGEVTIDVPEGKYVTMAPGYTLEIEDGADVTIAGAGADKTFIEGEEESDVLEVEDGASLTIKGATVKHGREDEGGGIYVSFGGSLVLEGSTITENTANFVGGGIYGERGSSIAVIDSTIADNRAEQAGGGIAEIEEQRCDRPDTRSSAKHPHADTQTIGGGIGEGLTVLQSTIEGNTAEDDVGGGIYVGPEPCEGEGIESSTHASTAGPRPDLQLSDEEPRLSIEQSTIAKNQAGEAGGGIYEETRIDDPIVDSTITENFASYTGGGIAVGEGVEDLVSDTVSENSVEPEPQDTGVAKPKWSSIDGASAAASGAGHDAVENQIDRGSNLAADPYAYAAIELRNTIIAQSGSEISNCEGDVESLVFNAGYNLDYPSTLSDDSDTCGLSEEDHDLVGVKPELDPKGLQPNGGPTETIALLATSPAVGFVPVKEDCEEEGTGPALPNEHGTSTPVDQRGVVRPGIPGKGCDIGAYEYQEPAKQEVKNEEKVPAPAPAASSVLSVKISSPAQCASKRDITIHIQNVKHFGIASAVVSIDGHDKKTLSGKHLSTGINLRGLPPGTFTVEIVAHTHSGHTLKGKRVYHTCHTKLPGHSYLRL